jgi:hypothetical protein
MLPTPALAASTSLLVLSLACLAARAEPPALRSETVLAQQQALRQALDERAGRYGALPRERRERIRSEQDRLATLLAGTRSTDDLAPGRRAQVFAALDAIQAEIDAPGDDRVVCTREARTGSNVLTRVCRSARQRREEGEAGRARLEEARRASCASRDGCT